MLIDRLYRPKHDDFHGVDWGRDCPILIKRGDEELFWHPGGTVWSGMYGNRYHSGTLYYAPNQRQRDYRQVNVVISRLSNKTFAQQDVVAAVDELFGPDVASKINTRKTLTL